MKPGDYNTAGTGADRMGVDTADFGETLDYVTVTVDGQLLGLPIARVQDVFIAHRLTPVPLAPREIIGLINLRGRVLTAICLRRLMSEASSPEQDAERELVAVGLDHGGEAFALIVDRIGEVLRLDGSTFEPVPIHLDRGWAGLASGVHRLEDRLLVVLDVDAVLDIPLPVAA